MDDLINELLSRMSQQQLDQSTFVQRAVYLIEQISTNLQFLMASVWNITSEHLLFLVLVAIKWTVWLLRGIGLPP
uniref:Uncharacterized protein n=1 Tax=Tetranychus urticae TaxID=32264 RepID=T1JX13_TETUR